MLTYILFFFVFVSSKADDSIPITQAYPGAFTEDPNILVTNFSIHGVQGFRINEFPANESRRNHFDGRNNATIKYLIMHFTEEIFTDTVNIFTSASAPSRTSAHYVITEKEVARNLTGGRLLQVVPENLRAWHAGVSAWGSDTNLNYNSIGIEHVNLGYDGDETVPELNRSYYSYDLDQMRTSGIISKDIMKQYGILPQNVLGHEDIAPPRKPDPGPMFPWKLLYANYGVGAWLDDDEMTKDAIIQKYNPPRAFPSSNDQGVLLEMLFSYGFSREGNTANDPFVILAFKKHFSANQKPELCYNVIRDEDMFWAWALEAKYITFTPNCLDVDTGCQKKMGAVIQHLNYLFKIFRFYLSGGWIIVGISIQPVLQ